MTEALKTGVQRYFAEFPAEIPDAIYEQLLLPQGLEGLLRRLSLPTDGAPPELYARLIHFLRKRGGIQRFMAVVRPHGPSGASEVEATQLLPESHPGTPGVDPAADETIKRPLVKTYRVPAQSDSAEGTKSPARSPVTPQSFAETQALSPPPARPAPPLHSGPLKPGSAPAPGSFDAKTPSWDPSKPHDPNGTWPEVERRCGRERRKGSRRLNVDIVYKNQRFGRDRRAELERRRNWPKGGHKS